MEPITGIHHVTAISQDPQSNVDFYAGVLGLRLVKRTVNFDDPGTYHLYYGDELGHPGTIVTFFPSPHARPGRRGVGQADSFALAVPDGSLGWWKSRLEAAGRTVEGPTVRFGERVLTLDDHDGIGVELTESDDAADRPFWERGGVEAAYAVRGCHSVTLHESEPEQTAAFLEGGMEFRAAGEEGSRTRFSVGEGGAGALVDVVRPAALRHSVMGSGCIHHVAWRVGGDEAQKAWQSRLRSQGVDVTPVMDRNYFHSIYYREPGGVIFEIATDPPGFATDETRETLGTALKLPEWLEPHRGELEAALTPLRVPHG